MNEPQLAIDLNLSRSASDLKEYRLISLRNGLEALLISSKALVQSKKSPFSKSAAAISVSVGSFSDPNEAEGLAHFLEHMLFMGNEKYPNENEYDEFITSHSGECNAYTEGEHTVYYFDIMSDNFFKAFDIFAQCFISPKLNINSADREITAIENEFQLASTNDSTRRQEVLCYCSQNGHFLRKFGWGNKHSLKTIPVSKNIDMGQMLKSFYNLHYTPNNMKLVVLSPHDLDLLQVEVESTFGSFTSTSAPTSNSMAVSLPLLNTSESELKLPLNTDTLGKLIYRIIPLKKTHKVFVTWQLPPSHAAYRKKPLDYIAHLLGHEGPGSLLSALKEDGYATGVAAGSSASDIWSNSMFTLFSVSVSLTLSGAVNWPSVVETVYQYLAMVKDCGVQKWIFDELQQISNVAFETMEEEEESEIVQELCAEMLPQRARNRQDLLRASFLYSEWDPESVTRMLSLMSPSNARVEVTSSLFRSTASSQKVGGNEDEEEGDDVAVEMEGDDDEFEDVDDENEEDDGEDDEDDDDEDDEVEDEDNEEFSTEQLTALFTGLPDWLPICLPPGDAQVPREEPHFHTLYWEDSLPQSMLACWSQKASCTNSRLHLPPRNPYIPTDLTIIPIVSKVPVSPDTPPPPPLSAAADNTDESLGVAVVEGGGVPLLVWTSDGLSVWHTLDSRFPLPKVAISVRLCSKAVCNSAATIVQCDLVTKLLADALAESLYLASTAELHSSFTSSEMGLLVNVQGFSHRSVDLLALIIYTLRCPSKYLVADAFSRQKEALERDYRNLNLKSSGAARETRLLALHSTAVSREAKLEAIADVSLMSLEALETFVATFLSTLTVQVLVHGNVSKEAAMSISGFFNDDWRPSLLPETTPHPMLSCRLSLAHYPTQLLVQLPSHKVLVIPCQPVNPKEPNVAVEMYFQWEVYGVRAVVMLDLLEHVLSEPFFNELRTKQQLGYSVDCSARLTFGITGFCFTVVSSSHTVAKVQQSIIKFVEKVPSLLKKMSMKDFNTHVKSLIETKLKPEQALHAAAQYNWDEIADRRFDFYVKKKQATLLETVKKEALLEFSKQLLCAPSRKLLVVQASVQKSVVATIPTSLVIKNVSDVHGFPRFPCAV